MRTGRGATETIEIEQEIAGSETGVKQARQSFERAPAGDPVRAQTRRFWAFTDSKATGLGLLPECWSLSEGWWDGTSGLRLRRRYGVLSH